MVPNTLDGMLAWSTLKKNCGHALGLPVASTFPRADVRGCGGFSLSWFTGGWAYGMPLNDSTFKMFVPVTVA